MPKRTIEQVYDTINSVSSGESTPKESPHVEFVPSGSDVLVYDSPDKEHINLSPFKTPTKRRRLLSNGSPLDGKESINSPSKRTSPPKSTLNILDSLIADSAYSEEIIVSSEDESIYSTARSVMPSQQFSISSSVPFNAKEDIKRARKTRLEVRNGLAVPDFAAKGVEIKNLGPKHVPVDSDNEVPDSDEEENDYSIIEVTLEEEEPHDQHLGTAPQLDVDASDEIEANTSVLQVPSSPSLRDHHSVAGVSAVETQPNDLEAYTVPELRTLLGLWDIKVPRSKQRMIEIITDTSKLVSRDVDWKGVGQNGESTALASIHTNITRLIQSNQLWYDRILSFEPILLENLSQWLESIGYRLELDILEKFCWKQGITCTSQRIH